MTENPATMPHEPSDPACIEFDPDQLVDENRGKSCHVCAPVIDEG